MKKIIGKGQLSFNQVPAIAVTLLIVAVTVGVTFTIMDSQSSTYTANSFAANASSAIQSGLWNLVKDFDLLGLILFAAIILGVIGLFVVNRLRN